MTEQHEVECSLSEPCPGETPENGEHDYAWSPSFCRDCERHCVCDRLHAHAERVLRERDESPTRQAANEPGQATD